LGNDRGDETAKKEMTGHRKKKRRLRARERKIRRRKTKGIRYKKWLFGQGSRGGMLLL